MKGQKGEAGSGFALLLTFDFSLILGGKCAASNSGRAIGICVIKKQGAICYGIYNKVPYPSKMPVEHTGILRSPIAPSLKCFAFFSVFLLSPPIYPETPKIETTGTAYPQKTKAASHDTRLLLLEAHDFVTNSMMTMPALSMKKRWELAFKVVVKTKGLSKDSPINKWLLLQTKIDLDTHSSPIQRAELFLSMGNFVAAFAEADLPGNHSWYPLGKDTDKRESRGWYLSHASRIKFEVLWSKNYVARIMPNRAEEKLDSAWEELGRLSNLLKECRDPSDRSLNYQLLTHALGTEKSGVKDAIRLRDHARLHEKMKSGRDVSDARIADSSLALAIGHIAKKDWRQAEKYFEEALSLYESSIGLDHPFTAVCLKCMAQMYAKTNRPEKAALAAAHALTIFEKTLENEPVECGSTSLELGVLLEAIHEFEAASDQFSKASDYSMIIPLCQESGIKLLSRAAKLNFKTGHWKRGHSRLSKLLALLEKNPTIRKEMEPRVLLTFEILSTALGSRIGSVSFAEMVESNVSGSQGTPILPNDPSSYDDSFEWKQLLKSGIVPETLQGESFEPGLLCLMACEKLQSNELSAAESLLVRALESAVEYGRRESGTIGAEAVIADHLRECLKLRGRTASEIDARLRSITRNPIESPN